MKHHRVSTQLDRSIAEELVAERPSRDCRPRSGKSYYRGALIDGAVRFLSFCGPGSFHEKIEGVSFSDMAVLGLALIGFSSPLSLMGRRDVYLIHMYSPAA